MNLQERKEILVRLGNYLQSEDEDWAMTKERATAENAWFTPEFISLSAANISTYYLAEEKLQKLIDHYAIPAENASPKKVGIVMAGNIPLVGFHDLLCTFLTGHYAVIKLSSKDTVLISFLVKKMVEWNAAAAPYFTFGEMLKGCDAYIATGSNNSSRYFDYYFNKYPHIIRKNRTSVAVLTGRETPEELESLADDVYQYFGLGCRNVTKIFVPENYNFEQLLNVFSRYNYLADHHKYRNNYDYNLAILLLNKRMYMSNESLLLVEDASPFSPISQLHYEYYTNADEVRDKLKGNETIQCVVGKQDIPFGAAQCPDVCDFADGVDTVEFLLTL
ncbi:MAG TPA: acyl-CoA reductase [Flavisolibacter sp.]|nr:acyl-CoA reductase [Flavisolibacter sp.]